MKTLRPLLLSLAAALALVPAAFAAQLGDAAAPLHIANWAKGKPVDLAVLKSNQVAVVEFWATWYAPCRTSIPHLTELQKKFKDVVFIGVSDEDADTVKKFVDKMGDKMDYRVAVDKDGQTGEAYMKAYGQNGIPTAFVVDKQGRIVWLGHPMGDLEKVLDQLLAGKYDLNKARKLGELQSKEEQYVELAGEGADESQLEKLAVEIAAMEKGIGDIGPDRKFDPAQVRKIVGFRKAMAEYQEALAAGKAPAELDRIATTLQAVAPPGFNLDEFRGDMAARRLFNDYYQAATKGTDKEELAALTKKIGEAKITNVRMLNALAWAILTDENFKTRDRALALKLARAAVDASEEKEPAALDTYARALFDSGKTADAVTWQKKAVALTKDDDMRKELEATLKKYEAKAK